MRRILLASTPVKEGDFTMVFGYPGSTSEYVPSYHIDMVKNYIDPKQRQNKKN
jgi:hypothetical protein